MKRSLAKIFISLCLSFVAIPQHAFSQQAEAEKSAVEIMKMIGQQKYKDVWATRISAWFKQRVPSEDIFLANMSMGRAQLGNVQQTLVISSEYAKSDPATGYQGDIYAITFKNSYQVGNFYERIVVIKEADGKYRLSGIFGSPAP